MNKEVINQSIDYILHHLGENISVQDVADHFHFSEFHFSRAFKAETGESVYAFIKRLKMDQSAIDMKLKRGKPISDIGLDYGYSSSNYSSAFRKHRGISPTQFRKTIDAGSVINPFHSERMDVFKTYDDYDARIKIKEIGDMQVIYEKMIGDYDGLREKWIQFMDTYRNHFTEHTSMIERFYDDPVITSSNGCICDLCITVDENCELENVTTIKGGKFAVYRFEGQIADIFGTLQGIFTVWFPESNYEMDEKYGINIYRAVDVANDYVVMDLCIPIR